MPFDFVNIAVVQSAQWIRNFPANARDKIELFFLLVLQQLNGFFFYRFGLNSNESSFSNEMQCFANGKKWSRRHQIIYSFSYWKSNRKRKFFVFDIWKHFKYRNQIVQDKHFPFWKWAEQKCKISIKIVHLKQWKWHEKSVRNNWISRIRMWSERQEQKTFRTSTLLKLFLQPKKKKYWKSFNTFRLYLNVRYRHRKRKKNE